ncbi:MAG: hypothetical protein COV76_04065 [Candidatus Omnitrophica bacterium CG11_big_fil_rev_8_21_14_0_20_64_10]|nr:MAG: hypothetical protein COV76_04065 [Candidatus Omnitrophica bacterium CG11_big_fil_rev_8_21_14_0_20_64_10]
MSLPTAVHRETRLRGAAVIGLGVGEQHARAYCDAPGWRLKWLVDLDPERARQVQLRLGNGAVADGPEILWADPEVQVVSIASRDADHADQVLAGLRGGKHLFVEKPLCRTLEELERIERAWEAAGRPVLMSNLVLRAAPLYRWAADAVADGRLGKIYAFDGDYLYGRLEKITEGWRGREADYSVMAGGGVHLVDWMLSVFGEAPVSVAAFGNRISTEGTSFRHNDYAAALYRFPSGAVGRITANFGSVQPHQHAVRIYGTRGTLISDDRGVRLFDSRDPERPPQRIEAAPLPAGKGALIPAFLEQAERPASAAAQALREFQLIRVCVAADRALASGRMEALSK